VFFFALPFIVPWYTQHNFYLANDHPKLAHRTVCTPEVYHCTVMVVAASSPGGTVM
jgi:hypothetical protein